MALLDFYYYHPWDTTFAPDLYRNPWLLEHGEAPKAGYNADLTYRIRIGQRELEVPPILAMSSTVLTTSRQYSPEPMDLTHILNYKECSKILACASRETSVPFSHLYACLLLCDYLDVSRSLFLKLIYRIYNLHESQFHRHAYFLYALMHMSYRDIGEWIITEGLGMPPAILYTPCYHSFKDMGMRHIKKRQRKLRKLRIQLNQILIRDPLEPIECWD